MTPLREPQAERRGQSHLPELRPEGSHTGGSGPGGSLPDKRAPPMQAKRTRRQPGLEQVRPGLPRPRLQGPSCGRVHALLRAGPFPKEHPDSGQCSSRAAKPEELRGTKAHPADPVWGARLERRAVRPEEPAAGGRGPHALGRGSPAADTGGPAQTRPPAWRVHPGTPSLPPTCLPCWGHADRRGAWHRTARQF